MAVHIGMTGTRDGMSAYQMDTFKKLLLLHEAKWLHHGDCVGADADAHDIAMIIGMLTHVHPPVKDDHRAHCKGDKCSMEKPYFVRNRDIVNESDVMLATPATAHETKGGTWYTINYAKKKGKPLYVIYPNGDFEIFNTQYECDWRES